MSHASGAEGTALLVVDVQQAALDRGPFDGAATLRRIAALIDACRGAGLEVVFVQHDGEPGEDEEPGAPGWEIHRDVSPRPGERVVRKRFNSAFRGTDLGDHLRDRGIGTLVVVGVQTEYCVDTTVRVAFEHGYRIVLPAGANTTFDAGDVPGGVLVDLYARRIWDGRFGTVLTMEDTLREIGAGGAFPRVPWR